MHIWALSRHVDMFFLFRWFGMGLLGLGFFLHTKENNRRAGQRFLAEYNSGRRQGKDVDEQAIQIAVQTAQRNGKYTVTVVSLVEGSGLPLLFYSLCGLAAKAQPRRMWSALSHWVVYLQNYCLQLCGSVALAVDGQDFFITN